MADEMMAREWRSFFVGLIASVIASLVVFRVTRKREIASRRVDRQP
jgi:hypothetical protein